HTAQLASGATKIDFSAGLVDLVSGLDRSTANTKSIIRLDSSKPTALRANTFVVISAFDKSSTSFDYLVGAGLQGERYGEGECLSRLEVDDQIEFGRLFDRQVGGPRPPQNFVDVSGRPTVTGGHARAIRPQAALRHELPIGKDRRQTGCTDEVHNSRHLTMEHAVRHRDNGTGMCGGNKKERMFQCIRCPRIYGLKLNAQRFRRGLRLLQCEV